MFNLLSLCTSCTIVAGHNLRHYLFFNSGGERKAVIWIGFTRILAY
jgi:hypothetical protein